MKHTFFLIIACVWLGCGMSYAQDAKPSSEKDWRIEVEPSAFLQNGFSLHIGRNLTQDNKFSLAFYTLATNIPNVLQERIFTNADSSDSRVGLQLTLNARYKFDILKGKETNPYVGLISGWEYFNLTIPNKEDLRVDVILLTPYVGAEIYLYKDIIYINPQLRSVFYLNPQYSIEGREETINTVFILPQVSVGVRF